MHSGIVDVLVCVCYCCQILRRFTETLVIKIMSVLIDYLGVFCILYIVYKGFIL